jgi:hypothetical protein
MVPQHQQHVLTGCIMSCCNSGALYCAPGASSKEAQVMAPSPDPPVLPPALLLLRLNSCALPSSPSFAAVSPSQLPVCPAAWSAAAVAPPDEGPGNAPAVVCRAVGGGAYSWTSSSSTTVI